MHSSAGKNNVTDFLYAVRYADNLNNVASLTGCKKLLLIIVFALFTVCNSVLYAYHPLYVSFTNMDVDAKKGSITLSLRVFTDDLETILHGKYNVDGWIGTPKEHRDCRRLLLEYLNERLSITVNNGENISLVTDSMTIADDVMWFYMKGTALQSINRIEVDNRVLTDFFSSQNNLVIINTGKDEIGRKLNRKTYKFELSL